MRVFTASCVKMEPEQGLKMTPFIDVNTVAASENNFRHFYDIT